MEKYSFVGKSLEEAKEEASNNLNLKEEQLIITEKEAKQGLFKSKKVEVEVIRKSDVINYIKEILTNIIKSMNIDPQFEVKERKENVTITVFSNNNNILIGKQGRTIDALSTIAKQAVHNEIGTYFNFIIDVGEYKIKQQKNIERLAKNIAREVDKTKVEAKLDPMNSYERRLIHSILTDDDRVYTESIGEEPNRCVVIKPKESK